MLNHKKRKSPGAALRGHLHGCKALPAFLPSSHSCSAATAGSSPLPPKIHPDIAHAFLPTFSPSHLRPDCLIHSQSLTICRLTTVKSPPPAQPRAPEFQTPFFPPNFSTWLWLSLLKKSTPLNPKLLFPACSLPREMTLPSSRYSGEEPGSHPETSLSFNFSFHI